MKKRLLKPPQKQREILFLPEPQKLAQYLKNDCAIGTCHQLTFFNPGVAIRFIFLDLLKKGKKKIFFMDTDRTQIFFRIPQKNRETKRITFVDKDEVLCNIKVPNLNVCKNLFLEIENQIRRGITDTDEKLLQNLMSFQKLFFKDFEETSLREKLSKSFLRYMNIQNEYMYLSNMIKEEQFYEFFLKIYKDDLKFREIYNDVLDEYGREFSFRYKNYPFPKLKKNELPFWIVQNGRRFQFQKSDLSRDELNKYTLFPKASPLTLFLRLYCTDIFIHGIGGANYEWVNDKLIERFFNMEPPPYFVMSATFYIDDIPERDYSYFLLNPELIRKELIYFMKKKRADLF